MRKYIFIFLLLASNLFADDFISDLKEISGSMGTNDTVFIKFIDDISTRLSENTESINGIFRDAESWGASFSDNKPGYWISGLIYVIQGDRVLFYKWGHGGYGDGLLKELPCVSMAAFNDFMGSKDRLCDLVSGVFAHDFCCDSVVRRAVFSSEPQTSFLVIKNKGEIKSISLRGDPTDTYEEDPETGEWMPVYVGDERALQIYKEKMIMIKYWSLLITKPWVPRIKGNGNGVSP